MNIHDQDTTGTTPVNIHGQDTIGITPVNIHGQVTTGITPVNVHGQLSVQDHPTHAVHKHSGLFCHPLPVINSYMSHYMACLPLTKVLQGRRSYYGNRLLE